MSSNKLPGDKQQDIYSVSTDQLLRITVEQGGSDLHLTAGVPPQARINGELTNLDFPVLTRGGCPGILCRPF